MEKTLLLSVDLGTSFIKAGIYDTDSKCIAVWREPVNSESAEKGSFIQKGGEIFAKTKRCIRKVTERIGDDSRQIAAIGFTGQMAGVIGVDENWNDITAWSCSLDTRYIPYAKRQMRDMKELFLNIGGTNSPLMAPKCRWFAGEFPDQASKVAKYMLISSYIIGKLGHCRIEDVSVGNSYATWTGLADIRKGAWSETVCKEAGISVSLLPRLVDGTEIVGYLAEEYAKELHLPGGIPLAAGAGDKIAGCVGTGILDVGNAVFEASSYGALSCVQEEYRPNPKRYDYDAIPGFLAGRFYLHRYLPGSGITLKWFLDVFDDSGGKKDPFREIENKIVQIPCGSEGVMALGLLGGSAMPLDGMIRGAWIGYSWNHRKEHFYRSLLESYAYEVKATLDSIAQVYPEWDRHTPIYMIGGGASSDVWMQIMADVTGTEFIRNSREDAALWGSAVIAGKAVGIFEDLHQKAGGNKEQMFFPDSLSHKKYQKYVERYEQMKETLHVIYERNADL